VTSVLDVPNSSASVGMDTSFADSLLRIGRHFQRGEASADLRALHQIGGR
jgi:nitrate reductase alpha subunit